MTTWARGVAGPADRGQRGRRVCAWLLSVVLLLHHYGLGYAFSFWDSHLGLCTRPWRKVYEHDYKGVAVFGDLDSLTSAVTTGDVIRVVIHNIHDFQENTVYALQADNVVRRRGRVCLEALSSLNHFNHRFKDHTEGDTLWNLLLCSTGHLHVMGLLLGNRHVLSERHLNASASWFLKSWTVGGGRGEGGGGEGKNRCAGYEADSSDDDGFVAAGHCGSSPPSLVTWPVYSNFNTGVTAGRRSISVLLEAVRRGQDVQAVMRDRGYSFPMHGVRWSAVEPEPEPEPESAASAWVNGHSVMHVGQRHYRSHVGMRSDYPYLWLSSWSTTGRRHNSRWALDGRGSQGANEDAAALDWMTDACWRHVFTNDARGQRVRGSMEELLASVRSGHRVRVVVGNMAAEADVIRVRQGRHLAVQLLTQLAPLDDSRDRHHLLHDLVRWRWQVVHTTGTIWRYEVLLGNHTALSETKTSAVVSWFVDTRPWSQLLLRTNKIVTSGHVRDVADAVRDGAAVRLRIHHLSDDGDIFVPAVNLKIQKANSGETVTSAQIIRHLSDEESGDVEMRLQEHLTWWMTTLDTTGVMSLSAWNTARKAKHFEITLNPEIEWFANM